MPVEIAHIDPWSKVQEHTFGNLIALCPTCHSRYDKGEIDRQSMIRYKANLAVLSSRYGDLERRVLEALATAGAGSAMQLPGGMDILLMYLLQDGLLTEVPMGGRVVIMGMPATKTYALTPEGLEFVSRWLEAQEL